MKVITMYENLKREEIQIIPVPWVVSDDEIISYAGIKFRDYISKPMVSHKEEHLLNILIDYISQFKIISIGQIDALCDRFTEVYDTDFSVNDLIREFCPQYRSSEAKLICSESNTYGLRRGDIEINDISTNIELVSSIINAINTAKDVSDIHLQDIVNDFTN